MNPITENPKTHAKKHIVCNRPQVYYTLRGKPENPIFIKMRCKNINLIYVFTTPAQRERI